MLSFESSGFIVCLGVSLLLSGMIMYYCKQKMTQYEHKLDSMFQLISALTAQINSQQINSQQNNVCQPRGESYYEDTKDNAEGSVEESVEENNDSYEPSNNHDKILHPYMDLNIKSLNLTSNFNNNQLNSDSNSESDESESEESDSEESVNDRDEENKETIKIVELPPMNNENPPLELEELETLVMPSENNSDTSSETKTDTENETMDYNKMNVVALKKIVSEKKLVSNSSKLKKAELLQLLQ